MRSTAIFVDFVYTVNIAIIWAGRYTSFFPSHATSEPAHKNGCDPLKLNGWTTIRYTSYEKVQRGQEEKKQRKKKERKTNKGKKDYKTFTSPEKNKQQATYMTNSRTRHL
jgi:hypothetical protein